MNKPILGLLTTIIVTICTAGLLAAADCTSELLHGECFPLHFSTQAPTGACDSPCPTSTCAPACVAIDWDPDPNGGFCGLGEEPCTYYKHCPVPANICTPCTCNPVSQRCVDTASVTTSGITYKDKCSNP